MSTEFESLEGRNDTLHIPNRKIISGMPERVGLSSEDVEAAFRDISTLEEAKEFVSGYLSGVRSNIDDEFSEDAPALARRHLIEFMWAFGPSNGKVDHPSLRPTYLIVEAMEEILPFDELILGIDDGSIHQIFPQDLKYREIARVIRERKAHELRTRVKLA